MTANRNSELKGQFFSYDAIVAGILFILLLTLLYNYWNSLRTTVSVRIDDASRIALSVSSMLLTPGYPLDWNATNFNQIGLAEHHNTIRISEAKVSNLSILSYTSYQTVKERLGIGPYEFFITIADVAIGSAPTGTVLSKVTIVRPVIYKDQLQNLSVTIWSSSQ
ncbi:MAG: hypothetical protein N3G74_02005 [Candidatus Micrarchaeota archaeon]|nr:hypothetical protein [Candidatus Micrarchaeota archaeon]